jgi:NAD(P)-dependent dehydrogenase (short-subunit alcohol dehydrogenase family)
MDGMMRAGWRLRATESPSTLWPPGWIATASSTDAERLAALHTPPGRASAPDEVAAAVLFFASPDASCITVQSLVIDGGNILQESYFLLEPLCHAK